MTLAFVPRALDVDDLEDWGAHPHPLNNTAPHMYGKVYYADEQGHENGIWECTPGDYHLKRESSELCFVLAGHWILTGEQGDTYELRAGDMITLEKGWCGKSHVVEKVRKVYSEF